MNRNKTIVDEIRNIRKMISLNFNNDPDRYIDYLLLKKSKKEEAINCDFSEMLSPSELTAHPPNEHVKR
jgi:hypothetical protein